jgi:DNA-binding transcriptional regulator YdaS (Cro superfamily)
MKESITLLGVGFYIRAEAARLLKVRPARLNRWVQGYTYKIREESKQIERHKGPIVLVDLPTVDSTMALSFVELMESFGSLRVS